MEQAVQEYYGEILKTQDDLQTNCCKCSNENLPEIHKRFLSQIHEEITTKFYGCGSPIPFNIKGCTVLDLGCGTGRDVYLVSALVGPNGKAIGVDMTVQQLQVARKYVDYHKDKFGYSKTNVEFVHGNIENLPIPDGSIDAVISNCVINLANNKETVFNEVYRVLKNGGELLFSDVFSDRRISTDLREDPILYGECLSGALYIEDFRRIMHKLGFLDYRILSKSQIIVENPSIKERLGNIQFYSITVRAFKLESLEDRCEDYGQKVTYIGGLEESPCVFNLDQDHSFPINQAFDVCGNTAEMLSQTRYSRFFDVTPRGIHQGLFDCSKGRNQCNMKSGCC